jgi:uridine kinase
VADRVKANHIYLFTGIMLRATSLLVFLPHDYTKFILPFLNQSGLNLDPWTNGNFLNQNDEFSSYGLSALFIYLPVKVYIYVFGSINAYGFAAIFFFALVSLIPDVVIAIMLKNDLRTPWPFRLWIISPVVIYSTYVLGQNDLWVAMFLLLFGYFLAQRRQSYAAGVFLGLAIGFKYGVLLVVPFLIIYMIDNPRYKKTLSKTLKSTFVITLFCYSPLLWSSAYRSRIFKIEESSEVLKWFIVVGENKIYFTPVVFIALAVWIYRSGRTSVQVLLSFVSVLLISISIVTPLSFGWLLWGFPLLMASIDFSPIKTRIFFVSFQLLFIAYKLDFITKLRFQKSTTLSFLVDSKVQDLLTTIFLCFAFFFLVRLLGYALQQGDRYRLGSTALVLHIAGDSGVGKDTFSNAMVEGFGIENTQVICGDDYHLYERGDFAWGAKTHLNPKMNDLYQWGKDLDRSIYRTSYLGQTYDHTTGRFSEVRRNTSDLIISQGLHAHYPEVSKGYGPKIFLEMQEDLRINLKTDRDFKTRGRSAEEIESQLISRKLDYQLFIENQRKGADVVVCIRSTHIDLRTPNQLLVYGLNQKLLKLIEQSFVFLSPLSLTLTNEGLQIDTEFITGDLIQLALKLNLSSYDQFFPDENNFGDGIKGIMQLIGYLAIDEERLINVKSL